MGDTKENLERRRNDYLTQFSHGFYYRETSQDTVGQHMKRVRMIKGLTALGKRMYNNLDIFLIVSAICIVIFFAIMQVIDVAKMVATLIGLISALLVTIVKAIKGKRKLIIISLATSYVIDGNERNIDDLLGVLIGGNWNKYKEDPIAVFFGAVRMICLGQDNELKRRVTEALPALFSINLKEGMALVELLRRDWDEVRTGDNRRRTVEALPTIMKKESEFVKENLNIIENDEIYTIIAIVEVIFLWGIQINRNESTQLYNRLISQMNDGNYDDEYIRTVKIEWAMLNKLRIDRDSARDLFDEIISTSEIYPIICVARNLLQLCPYYPKCKTSGICKGSPGIITKYVNMLLDGGFHKNIRRPMAKENTIDCLAIVLKRRDYNKVAKDIFWKLIKDPDTMISRPVFDKAYAIFETDRDFLRELVDYVVMQTDDQVLQNRVKEFENTLTT